MPGRSHRFERSIVGNAMINNDERRGGKERGFSPLYPRRGLRSRDARPRDAIKPITAPGAYSTAHDLPLCLPCRGDLCRSRPISVFDPITSSAIAPYSSVARRAIQGMKILSMDYERRRNL